MYIRVYSCIFSRILSRIDQNDVYEYYFFSIYDMCFRPDGTQLIVAAGNRVLVKQHNFIFVVKPIDDHDVLYIYTFDENI